MITIRYDDIDPPGIYIKFSKKKEWQTVYITDTVHANKDKEGNLCSMLIRLPRDTTEEVRKVLRTINK